MDQGADGSIGSTFDLIAGEYIRLKKMYLEGKHAESLKMPKRINEIISVFLPLGVFACLKYAITARRGIPMGDPRAPFTP